jgi:type IV secretory pathway TraG/TraD family ATPase VirD4
MSDYHKSEMLMYFTSKFTPMVTAPQIRNIVGQQKSAIDFGDIMRNGKILLVTLSSGQIGKMNSTFLGSMVVSRLLWTALGRAKDPPSKRKQFFLYVDEFQNFITDSFEQILSEARKYGLSLTIAHQHLDQLRAMGRLGDKIQRAVFGNIGTMICFRVGDDGEYLAKQLGSPVEESSLRNLANRYAVATIQVEGVPSTPFTMKTLDWTAPATEMVEKGHRIRDRARKRGRLIEEVQNEIKARFAKV